MAFIHSFIYTREIISLKSTYFSQLCMQFLIRSLMTSRVVLGDFGCIFGCDVRLVGKIPTRFQAPSGNSGSANWPG